MRAENPLRWPPDWARSRHRIKRSRFKTTLAQARNHLENELRRLGARGAVLTSNLTVRNDGQIRGNSYEPMDGGIALYFRWRGRDLVIACDTYQFSDDNMRAISKTIEAMRAIERYGASHLLERAVSGFTALPAGEDAGPPPRPWWEVLNIPTIGEESPQAIASDDSHFLRAPLLKMAEALYKQLVNTHHPDRGGDAKEMADINLAIEEAREALR